MDEKLRMLEEIIQLDESALNIDAQLKDIEEWDSISKLALMASVKKKWGEDLTVEKLQTFVTVRDICEYLEHCEKKSKDM